MCLESQAEQMELSPGIIESALIEISVGMEWDKCSVLNIIVYSIKESSMEVAHNSVPCLLSLCGNLLFSPKLLHYIYILLVWKKYKV